ncbi:AMP-binding protein [Hoeflea prorocentri]|uniref:AMP-binding protein n=1 Tax=Hoeflea prorocentri TaxID=1922333 RepID=A0A9X3UF18_9HYPH|nr:AMP-binding protein [Hoeflea prorocentri]MCY6379433.1 AMP-binding protein [Hoeflea prorocentri]MDA5397234.1 AMP-binding protein [Hoeflea prorocentri]
MISDRCNSVYNAFEDAAGRWPGRDLLQTLPGTAKVYGIPSGTMRYGEAKAAVDELSARFEAKGYRSGMRVAVLLENRPVFFIVWLALNRLGISIVPINPDLRAAELEYLIGHSEPALIIAVKPRQDELRKASAAAGMDLSVVGPHDPLPAPRGNSVVAQEDGGEAAVLYTSGTTGNPKGCVLPNAYFLLAGNWYASVGGLAALSTDGERMITPLPVFHMNAMAYSFMAMIAVGGCLIVLDRFHPRSWWSDVAQSRATCLHYLGVMPSMLMGADPSSGDKEHCVQFGFGAGVDPKLQAAFEDRFGFPLVEAWAMTETGAGAVIAAHTTDRLVGQACLGRPGREVACRIVDEEGNEVTTGAPGELLVRRAEGDPRYGFFSHYYKDPEATEDAWRDGWFHTGDIVRRNEHGDMFFVDRKKNVIRRSGENIAAVEVESILMRHPQIKAAGVTSVPDPIRGDEVFACLVVDDPSPDLAVEITEWCLGQMAYYKAPGHIAFVDTLPLTATQKVQRAQLKRLAADLVGQSGTTVTAHLKKRQAA